MRLLTSRRRLITPLAAMLMIVEAATGGAVALVHATERFTAPSAIESEHGQACIVLHDPARCAVCQLSGVATLSPPTSPAATLTSCIRSAAPVVARRRGTPARSTQPRAPPKPSV